MLNWIKWIFDGIGTELVSLVIGGVVGFKIGKHKGRLIQEQKAGSSAEQFQQGSNRRKQNAQVSNMDTISMVKQKQTAGNNAKQTQVGRLDDD